MPEASHLRAIVIPRGKSRCIVLHGSTDVAAHTVARNLLYVKFEKGGNKGTDEAGAAFFSTGEGDTIQELEVEIDGEAIVTPAICNLLKQYLSKKNSLVKVVHLTFSENCKKEYQQLLLSTLATLASGTVEGLFVEDDCNNPHLCPWTEQLREFVNKNMGCSIRISFAQGYNKSQQLPIIDYLLSGPVRMAHFEGTWYGLSSMHGGPSFVGNRENLYLAEMCINVEEASVFEAKQFVRVLQSSTGLKAFSLFHQEHMGPISGTFLATFFAGFPHMSHIKRLAISSITLVSSDFAAACTAIKKHGHLNSLSLNWSLGSESEEVEATCLQSVLSNDSFAGLEDIELVSWSEDRGNGFLVQMWILDALGGNQTISKARVAVDLIPSSLLTTVFLPAVKSMPHLQVLTLLGKLDDSYEGAMTSLLQDHATLKRVEFAHYTPM